MKSDEPAKPSAGPNATQVGRDPRPPDLRDRVEAKDALRDLRRQLINILDQRVGDEKRVLRKTVSAIERRLRR